MDFSDWLLNEINKRGWSQAELARRAGISRQIISNYINRQREKPDSDVLVSISRALNLPAETVFRAAGLLPPVSEDTEYQEEFFHLLSQLSPQERQEILELLRFKAARQRYAKPPQSPSRMPKPARTVLKKK